MDFSNFIAQLPDDKIDALNIICEKFFKFHRENHDEHGNAWKLYSVHDYILFSQTVKKFVTHFEIDFPLSTPENNEQVLVFFNNFKLKVSELYMEQTFDRKFIDGKDSITLTEKEVENIQEKINEIRGSITKADYIKPYHKRRVLLRLEKFQLEIHKAISNLDVFKAGYSEVLDMAEETGERTEGIVKRFKEIFSLTKSKDPLQIKTEEPPKQIEDKSGEPEED